MKFTEEIVSIGKQGTNLELEVTLGESDQLTGYGRIRELMD